MRRIGKEIEQKIDGKEERRMGREGEYRRRRTEEYSMRYNNI